MKTQNRVEKIRSGDINALARTITALESTQQEKREPALKLLETLLPLTGKSLRVGISGSPGAGKSTFIEHLGLSLVKQGHKLAVLTIDPSSQRTGGSILGDKTRMQTLSSHPNAYIRPSPTGGLLGGVARKTQETLLLCEAAGYDLIFIETVGVGQSETSVSEMVDCFLILLSPATGDDLQAIKKGLIELADLLVINKTDGAMEPSALETAHYYRSAMKILLPLYQEWRTPVLNCSALNKIGLIRVWDQILKYQKVMKKKKLFEKRRQQQRKIWLKKTLEEDLQIQFHNQFSTQDLYEKMETKVIKGKTLASTASEKLLQAVKE